MAMAITMIVRPRRIPQSSCHPSPLITRPIISNLAIAVVKVGAIADKEVAETVSDKLITCSCL